MEIKVLGVCGTPVVRKSARGETNTEVLLKAVMDSVKEEKDVQTDILWLAEDGFNYGCDQCNWCVLKQSEGKFCAKNDVMAREYYPKVIEADAMVLASPVYIGRMSWLIAAFIDRLRALGEGKYYGFRGPVGGAGLKDKVLGAASVAWFRGGGVELALMTMLHCTSGIFGMIPVYGGPIDRFQGGFGWGPSGISMGEPDQLANVKNDSFAMRSARNLGKRVVEMAKVVKVGKETLAKVEA